MAQLKISNIGEGLDKVELSHIIGESAEWYSYFGKMYLSFFEYIATVKPNNSALKYLPKVHENICLQKNLYKNIDSSFSHIGIHH